MLRLPELKCLPSLKSMQLAQFLIFFQKSGSYVKLRTRTIHFRGENTAGGTVTGGNFAIEVGNIFLVLTANMGTSSRIAPTWASVQISLRMLWYYKFWQKK